MLAGAAGRQKNQSRLSTLLAKRVGKRGDVYAILASFRRFEADERFAFYDIAVAGEVKRVERPVLRDALRQEFASAALLDKLAELDDLELDSSALHEAATLTYNQIEQLIANS